MKTQKPILALTIVFLAIFWSIISSAQLTGVVLEEFAYFEEEVTTDLISIPAGATTYRIYAELQDPDDFVSAVFAINNCHPLHISTTTSFINSEISTGVTPSNGLMQVFPELMYDSFLTIGDIQDGGNTATAFTVPENPLDSSLMAYSPGYSLYLDDGVWFTIFPSENGFPNDEGKVLLAQVTTTGELSYQLNLQIFNDGDQQSELIYLSGPILDCVDFDTVVDGNALGLVYPYYYCADPLACNYSSVTNPDFADNSVCEFESCYGCTNDAYCNYAPEATFDDGSCTNSCPSCSLDSLYNMEPNTLHAFPTGYTEEHFVLNEIPLSYQLHLQNLGENTVTDALVIDTISEYLDLETFQVISSSHDIQTSLDPITRELTFSLENIQLTDSTFDQAGSHGCILFRIDPLPDLPFGTVIENTAHIFFDDNPAVVTNTTWNTIFTCDQLATMEVSDYELCPDEVITLSSTSDHIETYNWLVNDEVVGNGSVLEWSTNTPAEYLIGLQAINPLCEVTNVFPLTVHPAPVAEITEIDGVFWASEGDAYQWYLNGVPVEGATEQTGPNEAAGAHTVEVFNEFGCSSMSDPMIIQVGVAYAEEDAFAFYPNPVTDVAQLVFERAMQRTIKIVSLTGQTVWQKQTAQSTLTLDLSDLAQGTYALVITDQTGNLQINRFVVN